jgi:uncharacterized protein
MQDPETYTEAEIEALERLCQRLAGFDDRLTMEGLDGAMSALLAGPRELTLAEARPLLLGEAWERAIGDPQDESEALALLQRRWAVLQAQLKPEPLYEEPDRLVLQPLIGVYDPAERDRLLAEGQITAEEAADWPLTGEIWALGFLETVQRLPEDWMPTGLPGDAARARDAALDCIAALTERDPARLQADLQRRYRGRPPDRDALIDDACFAVQDLRCLWLEQRTRPAPRRIDKTPGRNDPCPCGSGRKFKKCHGAADAPA